MMIQVQQHGKQTQAKAVRPCIVADRQVNHSVVEQGTCTIWGGEPKNDNTQTS